LLISFAIDTLQVDFEDRHNAFRKKQQDAAVAAAAATAAAADGKTVTPEVEVSLIFRN
jgi:hypothetical protein